MKVGKRGRPIENYGKKEQKEWLDNALPDGRAHIAIVYLCQTNNAFSTVYILLLTSQPTKTR